MTKVIQQMDMMKAAKLFFTNYFDFSGRASRGEFWWAYLAFFIVSTILFIVDGVIVGMIFGFTDNELLSITENEFLSNNGASNLNHFFDKEMEIFKALKLKGIPTTIIVDQNGYIISKHEGILKWGEDEVINKIKSLFY